MSFSIRKSRRLAWILPAFLFSVSSFAADRKARPFGVYAGFQSGSVESVNVGLNVADQWRVHAGDYATLSGGFKSFNVYEAGLIYLTSSTGLSPFVGAELLGIGLSSSNGTPSGVSSSLAAEAGVDWTAHNGFNLGMRALLPFSNFSNIRFSGYIGWYF